MLFFDVAYPRGIGGRGASGGRVALVQIGDVVLERLAAAGGAAVRLQLVFDRLTVGIVQRRLGEEHRVVGVTHRAQRGCDQRARRVASSRGRHRCQRIAAAAAAAEHRRRRHRGELMVGECELGHKFAQHDAEVGLVEVSARQGEQRLIESQSEGGRLDDESAAAAARHRLENERQLGEQQDGAVYWRQHPVEHTRARVCRCAAAVAAVE